MSLINKPYTYSTGAVIVAAEQNSNLDTIYNDYNGNITNANISASATIADTKLAQISTAGKVSGAALTSLSSIPSAAGVIPAANLSSAVGVSVQTVRTQTGAVSTTTTTIPFDDTIPQNTEGAEFMTLAITPSSATNLLVITVVVHGAFSGSDGNIMIAALFQDSTANALAVGADGIFGLGIAGEISFVYSMTAGTTSSSTFKVRAGMNAAGTFTFNGSGGNRRFGGVYSSSITIQEIKV